MRNKRLLIVIVVIMLFSILLFGIRLYMLSISDQIGYGTLDNLSETVAEESAPAIYPEDENVIDEEHKNAVVSEGDAGLENNTVGQEELFLGSENSDRTQKNAWIEDKIASMTVEEKVAQLFMLSPEKLTGVDHVSAAGNITKDAIDAFPVGGLIYFESNIESPHQIMEMIANTQSYALNRIEIPMFIAVDEEGGYVTRIAKNSSFDVPAFPYANELGLSGDADVAFEMGFAIGEYLEFYGFNVDFAPVADVLSNPENQVVKKRSFGSDAQLVSDMVLAELDGLKSHNIVGCVKHFPGHGATAGDTHEGYAYTEKTWEELLACEVVPFSNSVAMDVPMIMIGHISLPNVVGDHTPASMSYCMITEHLRDELGYDGIVITDSLEMRAITDSYSSKQAVVNVLKAGGDMFLDPTDFKSAYEGILSEIASGDISEERIDESVYRILNVKYELLKK